MKFEVTPFSVRETWEEGRQPVIVLDRPKAQAPDASEVVRLSTVSLGRYYVVMSDLVRAPSEVKFGHVVTGEKVFIPVFAYQYSKQTVSFSVALVNCVNTAAFAYAAHTQRIPAIAHFFLDVDGPQPADENIAQFFLGIVYREQE